MQNTYTDIQIDYKNQFLSSPDNHIRFSLTLGPRFFHMPYADSVA